MSRVQIIYLNRSCVQLYFIYVYHINPFGAERERIESSNTHAQRLVETLEPNPLLARAGLFLVSTFRPNDFPSVFHLP